nr:hypothetical protein [Candidatus Sigynarchaeota archaeon]
MVFVYEPLKFIMLFLKIPNCLLSIILAFRIKKLSNYILNYLFFISFIGWGIFIGLDGLLYIIAPNGAFLYTLANIFRDVCMIMIALIPLCFIQAGFIIKEGEEIALHEKKLRLILSFIVSFVISIAMISTDSIIVMDKTAHPPHPFLPDELPPTGAFSVSFDPNILANLFYISFVAWYVFGVFLMFFQQRREAGVKRNRTRYIMFGILMIPIGIVYFIVQPYIMPLLPVVPGVDPKFVYNLVGQIIWAFSPILVYIGMRVRVPLESEVPRAKLENEVKAAKP